uniref:UBA domain-containing protein n=1 Tax=Globisporangium ultimum (strain ATCC 200006 / CBS 805.95 / DAOM BR144) TaxID=431595 RepID=K3X1Y7_GLOUD
MGFAREDANASVLACGDNPDKCMVWIVSHLEEKQFLSDLNQASIESELSKRAEEKELKAQEHETMKKAKAFTALFTTSYMLSADSSAIKLKAMLSDAIGDVDPDSLLRVALTKLLKLEAQAIKWYKESSKCYLLQVAERLEASFGAHDVLQCCSKISNAATSSCAFVATLHDEERHLSKALFDMPENHGGVPIVFLKADKDMQFSLDDDGFEVVELDLTGDD